jgi:hypothetical protein
VVHICTVEPLTKFEPEIVTVVGFPCVAPSIASGNTIGESDVSTGTGGMMRNVTLRFIGVPPPAAT